MIDLNAMEKQLDGEYREVFQRVQIYGSSSFMGLEMYEDRMMNLYDSLMEVQSEQQSVEKVIGKSVEDFCKNYFKLHGLSEVLGEVARRINNTCEYILILSLIFCAFKNDKSIPFMDAEVSIMPVVFGSIFGIVFSIIDGVFAKVFFKNKKIKTGVYWIFELVLFIVGMIVALFFVGEYEVNVKALPVFVITGGYVIIYKTVTGILRYKRTGNFKNTEFMDKKAKKEFNEEIRKFDDDLYINEYMAKRFEKINKRRSKWGKEKMNFKDFAIKVRKEEKFSRMLEIPSAVVFIAIVIRVVWDMFVDEEHSFIAAIICSAILLLLEYKIYIFFLEAIRNGSQVRLSALDVCEEQGIYIIQYVENLKANEDKEN